MSKILSVIETAYRGTIEEQDDTSLWFTHILKNNGADISILLKSNAVNYAVGGQNAAGLAFGEKPVARSPQIDKDLSKVISAGVPVYLIKEDATDRGINQNQFIDGIKLISRNQVAELFDGHEQLWHW